RYADLTARDPSGSKEFSETRLQQAVTDVTGGVVKHNGGALVAPRPGMTQVQFDAIMAGIKDSDLPGVTTLSGTPITAAYLRTNARLESVADGRYLVQVGNDPARPQYAVYGAETGFPAAFIIDLRDRAPGQTPRQGSLTRMREAARAGAGPIGPLE
ncbi:MAG: hypothetical protein IT520_11830, partial [Burkholderiales bacterium]|nr:hypothetical protein [Burkholderiales bacterium]